MMIVLTLKGGMQVVTPLHQIHNETGLLQALTQVFARLGPSSMISIFTVGVFPKCALVNAGVPKITNL